MRTETLTFRRPPAWLKLIRGRDGSAPDQNRSAKSAGRDSRAETAAGRPHTPASAAPSTDLSGLAAILLHRWPSILALTVISLGLAASYLLTSAPTYQATTTLFIDPRPKKIITDDPSQTGLGTDFALLESQVAIIRSDAVLSRVVSALKLDQDPEFAPPPALGLRARIKDILGIKSPVTEPAAQALASLAGHVNVKRAQKTYVVEIEATSSSPVKAARLTQAVVDAYLTDQISAKSEEAKRTYAQIDGRLGELREQVRKSELRVDEFRRANGITSSEGGTVGEQQLTRINTELGSARGGLAEVKARLDEVTRATKSGTLDGVTDPAKTALVQRLREQLAQVSRREASLASQLLPRHPVLIDIRSQITELKSQIDAELKRLIAAAKADFLVAEARERELNKALESAKTEVARVNTAQIKQRELEQEVTASRELLRVFLARAKETDEQQKLNAPEARVISPASVPTRPVKPVPALIVGLGLLGGLAAGVSRALVLDHLDTSLRSARDVERRTRLRTIAVLPPLTPSRSRTSKTDAATGNFFGSTVFGAIARNMTAAKSPETHAARLAVANLLAALRTRSSGESDAGQTILITSPDGTAETAPAAFALALAAARHGDRVLLIDAASSRPALSEALAGRMPNRAILLHDKNDLASITSVDPETGLTILPIALADLSRLMLDQQRRLIHGLATLSEGFGLVVIDGGAALEDPSAAILTTLATSIVLVATPGQTDPQSLETAANLIDLARDRLAGVVLATGSA